jgi:hypothetical protein
MPSKKSLSRASFDAPDADGLVAAIGTAAPITAAAMVNNMSGRGCMVMATSLPIEIARAVPASLPGRKVRLPFPIVHFPRHQVPWAGFGA